jgi:SEC-C motif-containing protein
LNPPKNFCPCGSGQDYEHCCRSWHEGATVPNAERLMRSRYTAYVRCNEHYLLATWQPSTRPRQVEFNERQQWLGLKILEAKITGATTAEVEFIARYRVGGATAARLHERSRFVLDGGRWLYVDGDIIG